MLQRFPIITLMTDFGTDSPYIAAMKAAIYERLPQAVLVDLTHSVAPQDIRQGAFVWCDFTKTFPPGTVHVGVVDPGVGSKRRIITAKCDGRCFVGPDNGLLTLVFQDKTPEELVEVANRAYWRPEISATFHGRDIMAPVAAAIAGGVPLSELGPPLDNTAPPILLPMTAARFGENEWQLEILYVDHFGNLLLNAGIEIVSAKLTKHSVVTLDINGRGPAMNAVFVSHYSSMASDGDMPGSLVLLESSSGRLELAVVNGNASERLSAKPGDRVTVRLM